jgi:hypothetical protein
VDWLKKVLRFFQQTPLLDVTIDLPTPQVHISE